MSDNVCPACRKHRFAADEPEPTPTLPPAGGKTAEEIGDLRRGAVLYRNLLTLVAGQVVAALVARALEENWAYLLAFGVSIATMVTVYRLVRWIGRGEPLLWALGLAVPLVSLVVLLVLTKRVATEFERQGLTGGFFGPDPDSIVAAPSRGKHDVAQQEDEADRT
jgi:hypothetical protein